MESVTRIQILDESDCILQCYGEAEREKGRHDDKGEREKEIDSRERVREWEKGYKNNKGKTP